MGFLSTTPAVARRMFRMIADLVFRVAGIGLGGHKVNVIVSVNPG